MEVIKMKKILLFVLIGIIFATFASATGETLNRVISTSTVNAGNTFTVYYNVPNPNGAFVFSIKDTITGGCTVSTGGVDIIKLLTSPDTQTTSVTINTYL
jgi:hypothetical protein